MSDCPNLLVLLCDQLQRHALRLHGGDVPTPAWDRLADEGVIFDRAYCASPLCVPTRPSIMTGRWPHSHGAICGEGPSTVNAGEAMLTDRLLDGGYRVGYDGIWHVQRLPEDDRRGEFELFKAANFPYAAHAEMLVQQGGREGEQQAVVVTPTTGGGSREWQFSVPVPAVWTRPLDEHPDMVRARAIAGFLAKPSDRPFAAWCSLSAPHPPLLVPEPYFSLFSPEAVHLPPGFGADDCHLPEAVRNSPGAQSVRGWSETRWRRAIAAYKGYVAFADACMGVLLDALEASGHRDDTVILASADHGEMLGSHNLYQKGVMYERSIGVPLVIRAPGVRPGRRNHLVSHVDYAPTLLDLLGLPPLPRAQGRSLEPVLRNADQPGRDFLFVEFNGYIHGGTPVRAAVSERHKYAYAHKDREQLFDLQDDPDERRNLADDPAHQAVKQAHRQALAQWMQETGDFIDLE